MFAIRLTQYVLVVCGALLGSSCGAWNYDLEVPQRVSTPISKVSLALVESNTDPEMSEDDLEQLRQSLEQLRNSIASDLASEGIEVVEASGSDVASILGRVEKYDPGSFALRLLGFGGWKAGGALFNASWSVRHHGRTAGRFTFKGWLASPWSSVSGLMGEKLATWLAGELEPEERRGRWTGGWGQPWEKK